MSDKTISLNLDGVRSLDIVIEGNEGTIIKSLKDECPYCQQTDCYANCDGSQGDIDELETEEEMHFRKNWNATMDVIEFLIVEHAKAGVDVTSEAYVSGVRASLGALENNI
jgi:hypothetical protein